MSLPIHKQVLKLKKLPLIKQKQLKNFTKVQNVEREDLIYESPEGDSLPRIVLTNRVNTLTNTSCTTAKYTTETCVVVKTSDNLVKLIGQENYDTVFSALCSVINQQLKIYGILSLLTENRAEVETDNRFVTTGTQTDEKTIFMWPVPKKRKRVRRQHLVPFVVKDPSKKIIQRHIINPTDKSSSTSSSTSLSKSGKEADELPDITKFVEMINKDIPDTSDTESIGLSSLAAYTNPNLLADINVLQQGIDRYTVSMKNPAGCVINALDGTHIQLAVQPEDDFHIAIPENMRCLTKENKKKLLLLQLTIDFKHCLDFDQDHYLPLHTAVYNNDIDLVRRQCNVLKNRNASLDILADGQLSALQIAILQHRPECTALLLRQGADLFVTDADSRTCFHLASEADPGHLQAMVEHCRENARYILEDNEDLWRKEFISKSPTELSEILFRHLSEMYDSQGYTPLMLASKMGLYDNVRLLLETSPTSVDLEMPNCGNTALYIAVHSACLDAIDRDDKSKLAIKFSKTIETLLEYNSDPSTCNHSGSNVNTLLAEFNIPDLNMLLTNKSMKFFGNPYINENSRMQSLIFVKEDGVVKIEDIRETKYKKGAQKNETTTIANTNIAKRNDKETANDPLLVPTEIKKEVSDDINNDKPVVVQNVAIKSIQPFTSKSYVIVNPSTIVNKNPQDIQINSTKAITVTTKPKITAKGKTINDSSKTEGSFKIVDTNAILKSNSSPSSVAIGKISKKNVETPKFVNILPKTSVLKRITGDTGEICAKKPKK